MWSTQIDDIDALVNLAFPGTQAANSRLSFEQFCAWCEATPDITDVRSLRIVLMKGLLIPIYHSHDIISDFVNQLNPVPHERAPERRPAGISGFAH